MIDSIKALSEIIKLKEAGDVIHYIQKILDKHKIENQIFFKKKEFPNLFAEIKGKNTTSPLLLYAHADTVAADSENWIHPPYSGHNDGEYI